MHSSSLWCKALSLGESLAIFGSLFFLVLLKFKCYSKGCLHRKKRILPATPWSVHAKLCFSVMTISFNFFFFGVMKGVKSATKMNSRDLSKIMRILALIQDKENEKELLFYL